LSFLTQFWVVSWSVCALAVTIVVGLVIYSSWAKSRAAARSLKREHYVALLKAGADALEGKATMPADDVLTDLAVELLELVRGDEKARFAERVARLGTVARLHRRLRRGNVRSRVLGRRCFGEISMTRKRETRLPAHSTTVIREWDE
jgi:hypothetical protein